MKTFNSLFIAVTLVFALTSQSVAVYSITPKSSTPIPAPSLRPESQLRSEASQYDAAIREIERGATVKLDTAEDVKSALASLEKAIPGIRFSRSKLVTMGLDEGAFVNAVKERTRDDKTAEAFARELTSDQNAILKLNGATSLQGRLRQKVDSDAALLRSVGARLKKSAEDLKAKVKPHHSLKTPGMISELSVLPEPVLDSTDLVNAIIIITAIVIGPPLLLAVLIFAASVPTAIITAAMIAASVQIVGRLVENIGTDKGRDRVAQCQDTADKTYSECKKKAAELCCGLDAAERLLCYSNWLAQAGLCILS